MSKGSHNSQGGVALLEALIAILIISFGILGIIGLQATSVSLTTDARYRVEAAAFAERLVAEMWVSDPLTLPADYAWTGTGVPPAKLQKWYGDLQAGGGALPGVGDKKPTVAFGANNLVTVTVFWKPPQSDRFHSHTLISTVNQDPEN